MSKNLKASLLNLSALLLLALIAAGYAGNYFSYPFGFGVDFLFGSIAVLIVVSLYGIWWGAIASLVTSSYTIILWQHPYALIIFVCEALFVGWRLRRGKRNLLTSDMIFWVCIGIPLALVFYGYILQVGTVTTAIVALKQPVNGIFNALIASLILNYRPIYHWANSSPKKNKVFFEQILLNLLVAFVLIPTLVLMVVNNEAAMKQEQSNLTAVLDSSAQNLTADLRRWHQSGLEALRFLAQTSSQSQIVVSGQTQHGLDLAVKSLPMFKSIYMINAERDVIAQAIGTQKPITQQGFSQLKIPRIPQIFVQSSPEKNQNDVRPKILQTLPIILNERWLGNIVAELDIDFIKQLLDTEAYTLPFKSNLLDENQLLIASTDPETNRQERFSRSPGEINDLKTGSQGKSYHWLPLMEGKPLIARWRNSFYIQELVIDEEIPLVLCIEAPATTYIDYLQLLYIKNLAILLCLALASILMAKFVSRLLINPILKLATFTTNLPYRILRNETIKIPRSSVAETNALSYNFEVMSDTVEKNIQQIKYTNQKLRRAKEKSEVANKAKDQFLANISHELKTPLNSIIGYSRLIQKDLTLNYDRKRDRDIYKSLGWLDNVRQDGKYLLSLIDEILDLAKSQAHKTKLYPSLVSVSSFLEEVVLSGRKQAAVKNLSFKFETSGRLPTNIYADEQRLRQVLLNLLDNAVKYTERGQIILRVSQIDFVEQGQLKPVLDPEKNGLKAIGEIAPSIFPSQVCLRFEVIDTGIGIERDNFGKIFQPFEQIDKFEFTEVGTGLGLSISQQLVELMDGSLQVKSELNRGSVFWFDLTFPEIKVVSTIEAESVREIVGYQGDKKTLLIVDDVMTSRLLLQDILSPLGFKILTATNGRQGLELALTHKPDLILTDLFMPIKTGFTLIAELKQKYDFEGIPIVATSASTLEEVERQSRAAGCNAFLAKPIDDRKLLNLLGKYLNLEWVYKYNQVKSN